jgi:hypothetical protein
MNEREVSNSKMEKGVVGVSKPLTSKIWSQPLDQQVNHQSLETIVDII